MQYVPSITMPALTLMGIMHFRTYLSLLRCMAWHVYCTDCRDEIYGSKRYRLVEAGWDLLAYFGACRYLAYSNYCTIAKIVPPCMLMAVYVDHIDG